VEFNHPGIELEQKEATQNIMNKIAQLPQKQQTALILKSIEGLSQKEISVIMEISEKAIESLLSRARSSLKEKLGN
jgi:RNA polymerase sigma-70 factor (ECF subfamily)